MNSRIRRLGRLEARKAAKMAQPRRFIIPPKPRTDAERLEWRERFRAHQLGLVAFHRRERIAAAPTTATRPTLPVGMVAHPRPQFGIPKQWRKQ